MKRFILLSALLAGCASTPPIPPRPAPVTNHHPVLPTGASMIGTSTFATILDAPPDAAAVAAERAERQTRLKRRSWYGQEQGLSEEQARQARDEQGRLMLDFATLRNRLLREQAGNFVGALLRHEPSWAYVFFFKRDPEATLRHYTREPKFEAGLSLYSEADRKRIIEPWNQRWISEGIPFGYGLDAVYPEMEVELGIGETAYRALSAARGWGDPPAPIRLKYSAEPVLPAVDPMIANLVRGFAHERYATAIQLTAGSEGRIVLADGCLRLGNASGALIVFHRETGIGLDGAGYLALVDRHSGKVRGRIGEMMNWAGPNEAKEFVGLTELKAACGDGRVVNVGNPESKARMDARYPRN